MNNKSKQIFKIFSILLLILSMCITQIKAQEKERSLQSLFKTPLAEAKPYVWWHWMGSNFSKEGITKDLEAMKEQGIGGATIFNLSSAVQESHVPTLNNPWPQQTYRSPAYWEAMEHAAAEAKRLGIEIGLHNTVGYSTTGGPWISEEHAMKKLVWTKKVITQNQKTDIVIEKPAPVIDKKGWGRLNLPPVPSTWYKDIAYLAVALKDSAVYENYIDITSHFDASGKLTKALPKGDWIVYRLGYAPTMSTPHPVPDEIMNACLEADKMSEKQSLFHWNTVLNPLKKHLGSYFGNSFKHILIDSYEAGYQNWTDNFREEFIKRKGYDPLPWLLTFSSAVSFNSANPEKRIRNDVETTNRFDWDYKDVISQLYYEKGWKVAKELIDREGLKLQFESYGGPFNVVEGAALADLPMAEFWIGRKVYINPDITGAARAAGRNIVGAEAFTGSPVLSKFTEDPAFLKASATGAFASGINKLILHHWVHQPFDDKYQPGMGMGWWGTHFGRHQTWAKPGKSFFDYLAKTQTLLQYGQQTSMYLCLEKSLNEQSDAISRNDFLNQDIKIIDGKIVLPSGRRYPFLVLPNSTMILPEILLKIQNLVQQGATIVGQAPKQSYSLQNYPNCDNQVLEIANMLWTNSTNRYGKGFVFTKVEEALKHFSIQPNFKVEKADSLHLVKCLQRSGNEGDVYFVANIHNKPQDITVSFKQEKLQPEIWNAEDGTISDAPVWKVVDGRTLVQLNLKDNQSLFVVFRKEVSIKNHPTAYRIIDGKASVSLHPIDVNKMAISTTSQSKIEVDFAKGYKKEFVFKKPDTLQIQGAWNVKFLPKLDTMFTINFKNLVDFSKHQDKRIKYFSGTAIYQKIFKINKGLSNQKVTLDLGTVNDIVAVKLNGKNLGVYWYPPYKIEISQYLKIGENNLEIEVTNNWANRLIGDEQEPIDFEWGNDRGKNGRAMKSYPEWFIKNQPRPSQGRKTFSIWYYYKKDSELSPAGLAGPVQLISQELKRF